MKKTHPISVFVIVFVFVIVQPAAAQNVSGDTPPASVRDLAPLYGIRPEFLDDTNNLSAYLRTLPVDNHTLTDSCVSINARIATLSLALQHDYRRRGDTLWLSPTSFATDYRLYSERLSQLSNIALRNAYHYIQREAVIADSISHSALQLRLDSIRRNHNLIISTCDGIGIRDKNRQRELKNIYYAYLSVYNRYNFSSNQPFNQPNINENSSYLAQLSDFQGFQEDLYHDLLSPDNIPGQITDFVNTLRSRCGRDHLDVLRSYQRVFQNTSTSQPQSSDPVEFSTIYQYYNYIERLLSIRNWQQAYLTTVDLREKMDSNSRLITILYSQRKNAGSATYRRAADTYRQVEATINAIPAFSNNEDANTFITNLQNFVYIVQQGYISDYNRIDAISSHGDSIIRACSLRHSDVAKAYRRLADTYVIIPTYRTPEEAERHNQSLRTFQILQRQFDTILLLRNQLDAGRDSIADGWSSHLAVYNGYQNIRKQYSDPPAFINIPEGSQYIRHLYEHRALQRHCIEAINRNLICQGLESQITPLAKPYRNIRKAYNTLKSNRLTVRTLVRPDDVILYEQQHIELARIQQALLTILRSNDAATTDARLKGISDPLRIQLILGLPN